MHYTAAEQRLMDAMAEMDVIDCHEHLPPESERTGTPQDVFTLVSHYTRHDLYSAGMDAASADTSPWSTDRPAFDSLFDYDVPLAERWQILKPYWERIRHGSYARAALLTAQMVYGIDDINDDTYEELSERIAAENTPGIYRRMLCDRCRIRASLTQGQLEGCEPPLVPVARLLEFANAGDRKQLGAQAAEVGMEVRSLDDCLEVLRRMVDAALAAGAVGIKLMCRPWAPPDAKAAADALARLLAGEALTAGPGQPAPLEVYLMHQAIEVAADNNLVVAVHAGIWGDFRDIDCKHMLRWAPAHPGARFDLYHLGMPSVRDAIVVAKNLPNVYLNLCWTHIISQVQACSGIDELLDQVPVNKVLGFGGDYQRPVEKVVGHLHMAKEDYARVFGARIDRGLMGFDEALAILKLWFWDNPQALYTRLKIPDA